MPTWRVPMVDLRAQHAAIGAELQAAAMAVVERQAFILGEPVARFERTLEALSGTTTPSASPRAPTRSRSRCAPWASDLATAS